MIVGTHLDTCSVSLQTAIEEGVELTSIAEDNLTGEGDVFGEEDLVHCRTKLSVLSLDKMDVMVHKRSLQISLNRARTENIRGAARPVGS